MSVRTVGAAAVAAATTLLLAAQPVQPAAATPADGPPGELLAELRSRYRAAEAASEAYRTAGKKLRAQRERVDRLEGRLARTRGALAARRTEAGRLARRQYRGQVVGLPPAVRLLLADEPMKALHHGHALERAAVRQNATVRELASGERHRNALAAEARKALRKKESLVRQREQRRNAARDGLREIERMLMSLSPGRLAALRQAAGTGQADRWQSGSLRAGPAGTSAGRTAGPFARDPWGAPYGRDAEDPAGPPPGTDPAPARGDRVRPSPEAGVPGPGGW